MWPAIVELDRAVYTRTLLYASADDYRRFKTIYLNEVRRRRVPHNLAFWSAIYDLYDPAAPDPDPLLEDLKDLVKRCNGKDITSSHPANSIPWQFELRRYVDLEGSLRDRGRADDADWVKLVLMESLDHVGWKTLANAGRAPSRSTARIVKTDYIPHDGGKHRRNFRDYTDQPQKTTGRHGRRVETRRPQDRPTY